MMKIIDLNQNDTIFNSKKILKSKDILFELGFKDIIKPGNTLTDRGSNHDDLQGGFRALKNAIH